MVYHKMSGLEYDADHSVIFYDKERMWTLEDVVKHNSSSPVLLLSGRFSQTKLTGYDITVAVPEGIKVAYTFSDVGANKFTRNGLYFPYTRHHIDRRFYPVYVLGSTITVVPNWKKLNIKSKEDIYPLCNVKAYVYVNWSWDFIPASEILGVDIPEFYTACYQFPTIPSHSMRKAFRTFRVLGMLSEAEPYGSYIGKELGIVKVKIHNEPFWTWDGVHYYERIINLLDHLNTLFLEVPGYHWQFETVYVEEVNISILIKYVDNYFSALGEWWCGDKLEMCYTLSPDTYRDDITCKVKETMGY